MISSPGRQVLTIMMGVVGVLARVGAVVLLLLRTAAAQEPAPANLAANGRVLAVDSRSGAVLTDAANLVLKTGTPVAIGPGNALALLWDEPRELREIRLLFRSTPANLQFRVDTWQEHKSSPGSGPGGGQWVTTQLDARASERGFVLRLDRAQPAAPGSSEAPVSRGVRTRHVQISCSALVLVEQVVASGSAVMRQASLRFEWDPNTAVPGRWSPMLEARGGRITATSSGGRNATLVDVEYMDDDPESPDRGFVIVRSGEMRSFSVLVDDVLKRGGVTVRDLNVAITPIGAAPGDRTAVAVDASATSAVPAMKPSTGVPPPLPPLVLGVPGLRQKFYLGAEGEVELRTDGLRTPGPDRELRPWKWSNLVYQSGLGEHPRMGPRTNGTIARTLEDGWLPVVRYAWTNDGVAVAQTFVVSTLMGDPAELNTTNGCEPAVLVGRFEFRNVSDAAQTVWFWEELSRSHPLRLSVDGTLYLVAPSDGHSRSDYVPIRARFNTCGQGELDLAVLLPGGPGSFNPDLAQSAVAREAVRYRIGLEPGAAHAIEIVIPGLELLTPEQGVALKAISFAKIRDQTVRFWREQVASGMDWELPDPRLNLLLRANLWRLLSGIDLDPVSGGSHFVGSRPTPMRLTDLAGVVRSLELRGEHRAARLLLEPVINQQGVRTVAGQVVDHKGTLAALHPGGVDPYAAPATALDHARALEAVADHVFWARDPTWLKGAADRVVLACDWIKRGRMAAKGGGREAGRASNYPAGPLIAGGESAVFLRGEAALLRAWRRSGEALAAVDHPEAKRIQRDAAAFEQVLRALVAEAVAVQPVLRLRDGLHVPFVPDRTVPAVSALRTGAGADLAPVELVRAGAFLPEHPFVGWLAARLGEGAENQSADTGPLTWRAGWDQDLAYGGLLLRRGGLSDVSDRALASLGSRLNAALPLVVRPAEALGPADDVVLECALIQQWRDWLVWDDGEGLHLGAGIPRAWLQPGQRIHVQRAATRFGLVNLTLRSQAEAPHFTASVSLQAAGKPSFLRLQVRQPGGQLPDDVIVNGQPVRMEAGRSWVELPAGNGRWEVNAVFK